MVVQQLIIVGSSLLFIKRMPFHCSYWKKAEGILVCRSKLLESCHSQKTDLWKPWCRGTAAVVQLRCTQSNRVKHTLSVELLPALLLTPGAAAGSPHCHPAFSSLIGRNGRQTSSSPLESQKHSILRLRGNFEKAFSYFTDNKISRWIPAMQGKLEQWDAYTRFM